MPALGDPPTEPGAGLDGGRSAHGGPAPISYVPVPQGGSRGGGALGGGQRPGGRRPDEARPCLLRLGAVPGAAGSAYVEQGRTKVVAAVHGPMQLAGERAQGARGAEGVLSVDLQLAPFSTRGGGREEGERRAAFYGGLLQHALESVVMLECYAKAALDVSLQVLEDDGAVLPAALAVASLALADAGIQMRDMVAGATVHLSGGGSGEAGAQTALLDCEGQEERSLPVGSAVLHLGLCVSRGGVCLLHSAGPAQEAPLERMALLAKQTAEAVGAEMRRCLEGRVERRLEKRARLEGGKRETLQMGDAEL